MMIEHLNLLRQRVLIAEIGNNHEGDANLALEMIDAAAEAGADFVKIQVIDPERLVHSSQKERIAQLSKFRLPLRVIERLSQRATERGISFLASAFDVDSLDAVSPLISAIKIASGDIDFDPLLTKAASLRKPILLSTGAAKMDDIRHALNTIAAGRDRQSVGEFVALLHCVSLYPVPLHLADLNCIRTLQREFDLTTGYSDHCLGIEASLIALGLGARILEKHFTLDRTRSKFRDQALSADPQELAKLAEFVHSVDDILGPGIKEPREEVLASAMLAKRSIVVRRDMSAGERLTWEDLDFVRPQSGLPPTEAKNVVGKFLSVSLKAHDFVLRNHLSN